MRWAPVIGQEATSGSPLDFVQYGVLGLVIVAVLLGWLWAKPAVEKIIAGKDAEIAALDATVARIIADKVKAEGQRDALVQTMQEKVLPELARTSQVNDALRPVLEEVVSALEEFRSSMPPRSGRA